MRMTNSDKEKEYGNKWIIYIITCTMVFLYSVILFLPSPLITAICEDTGWSLEQAGSFMGMFNLFTGLCTFLATPLIDNFGAKKTALISLGLAVPGGMLALFTGGNFICQCLGRMFSGAGYGIMFPVPGTIISEMFPTAKKPRLLGIKSAVDFIGCSLAYYITLPIYEMFGSWQKTFALWGFMALVPIIAFLLFWREDSAEAIKRSKKSSWNIVLRQKWVWMLVIAQMGIVFPNYAIATYLPTYIQMELGYSPRAASSVTGTAQIAAAIAGIVAGVLLSMTGKRKPFGYGSMVGIIIGVLTALFGRTLPLIILGVFLVGFCVGMYNVFYSTVPADIFENRNPGLYAATISLILGLSSCVSALIPSVFQTVLDWGLNLRMALLVFVLPTMIAIIPCSMIKETGPLRADTNVMPYVINGTN